MRLPSIEFSFDTCNICRGCPRGVPRGKQNVVRKRSFAHEYCWKPVTRNRYTAISQWRNQNFIMGGRTVEGRGLGRGCALFPEKNWILTKKSWVFWCILRWLFTFMQKLVRSMGATHPALWIRHCYISEMGEDRWVHVARRLTSIEFSFDPCNIYCEGPRGVGYPADARSVGDSHPSCFALRSCYSCHILPWYRCSVSLLRCENQQPQAMHSSIIRFSKIQHGRHLKSHHVPTIQLRIGISAQNLVLGWHTMLQRRRV